MMLWIVRMSDQGHEVFKSGCEPLSCYTHFLTQLYCILTEKIRKIVSYNSMEKGFTDTVAVDADQTIINSHIWHLLFGFVT